jgi:uncharacterized Tic20 family protein
MADPIQPQARTIPQSEANTWGMLCHLSAFCALLGIPLGHILGPLVVWLLKKKEHPFIDEQGKESLNFQISMTIYLVVSALLCLAFIGFILFPLVAIADIVLVIIASIKASSGESYRYPLTIRFIK